MLVPSSDDHIARLAEIEAMRAVATQVGRLVEKVDQLAERMGDVREDIAVLKARDQGVQEFKDIAIRNRSRIEQLELANARDDGRRSALTWLLQNWPALGALIIAVLAILGVRPKI